MPHSQNNDQHQNSHPDYPYHQPEMSENSGESATSELDNLNSEELTALAILDLQSQKKSAQESSRPASSTPSSPPVPPDFQRAYNAL